MQVIGNLDWRNPVVRAKNKVAGLIKRVLEIMGFWRPLSSVEQNVYQNEEVSVQGSKSVQRRLSYSHPRPESESVSGLIYHPSGMAIHQGKIIERFSIRAPSVLEVLSVRFCAPKKEIECGTVVEMETPYTYGDWVANFICSLISAGEILEPVVLPKFLAEKSYVTRDLGALGLTYISAEEPIKIRNAMVLRKRLPSYYWSVDNVSDYRKSFGLEPSVPQVGSIIYLARFGTVSESVQRNYPSEAVAKYINSIGGMVIDAREASPELFNQIWERAETVIADQGSALFGVMHWQTKNVIELTNDSWWHSANLFIANGAGVKNYAVISVDQLSDSEVERKIAYFLSEFGVFSRGLSKCL